MIRGLNDRWVEPILGAAARTVAQSRRLEQQGKLERVDEGWITPDGTLFIPAAHDGTATEGNRHLPVRELVAELGDAPDVPLQVMVPAVDYQSSSALFQCGTRSRSLCVFFREASKKLSAQRATSACWTSSARSSAPPTSSSSATASWSTRSRAAATR